MHQALISVITLALPIHILLLVVSRTECRLAKAMLMSGWYASNAQHYCNGGQTQQADFTHVLKSVNVPNMPCSNSAHM